MVVETVVANKCSKLIFEWLEVKLQNVWKRNAWPEKIFAGCQANGLILPVYGIWINLTDLLPRPLFA